MLSHPSSASHPPGGRSSYRSDIDGLRAIAVVSVLLYHAGFSFVQGGFSGVDIFFVISGLLIGGHIYAEERDGRFSFRDFYARRAKRILPAVYLVMLASLFAGTVLLSPGELRSLSQEAISTLFSGSNVYFWQKQGYFDTRAELHPLLMTWSLGVEEQFYMLVPLLMILLARTKRSLAAVLSLLAVLTFAVACFQVARWPSAAFYLLPARGWELLAGVLLALFQARRGDSERIRSSTLSANGLSMAGNGLSMAGALLILWSLTKLSITVPFPGLAAMPAVLGTVLLLASEGAWLNRVVLSAWPMRWIGRLSYSLYLWHWPLLSFSTILLGVRPSKWQASMLLTVAFLLSIASYTWIEKPFRKSRKPPAFQLMGFAAATAVLAVVCLLFRESYGLRFRNPELARIDRGMLPEPDPCQVFDRDSEPNRTAHCREQTGRSSVATWGDSHVSTIASTMRRKAHESGYDFDEFAKTACPPLYNAGMNFRASPGEGERCIQFNRNVLELLARDPKVQVVVLAANWQSILTEPERNTGWLATVGDRPALLPAPAESVSRFQSSLERTVALLRQAGKQVVVFEDVPSFRILPVWRMHTQQMPARRWLLSTLYPGRTIDPGDDSPGSPEKDATMRAAIEQTARQGASIFDLEGRLCPSPFKCIYRDDSQSFYKDSNHLSPAGADYALAQFSLPPPDR